MQPNWKVLLPAAFLLTSITNNVYSAPFKLVLEPVGSASTQSAPVTTQIAPPQADYTVHPTIGAQVRTIEIDISCSFFGAAIPNCEITNSPPAPAEPNTGGHSHSDSGRPLGTLEPLSGNSGSDAFLTVTYTAPIASGVVRVSGSGFHPTYGFFSGQFTIGILVPSLQELPGSTDYDRIGVQSIHPQSHFGTAAMLASLQSLAQAYKTAYPGYRLAYNDMSLPFGGIFDLAANWGPDHISHRLGTDADVHLVPTGHREKLRRLISRSGISKIIIHGNHWHLRQ